MEPLAGKPPPISGGTLIVLADGVTAVAADPDEDRVWKVDLANQKVVGDVLLERGDEPGRLVEDAAGRIHVGDTDAPSVAQRTSALPDGRLPMLHQRAQAESVSTRPGGYTDGESCPGTGIVHHAITLITPGTAPSVASRLMDIPLAVDLAVSPPVQPAPRA